MVSSNSSSKNIIIIIVIFSSSSINKISVSLTISTTIFELLISFLLFYINIPHRIFVLSLPSHVMENFFTTIFNFNEFIFVNVVNIIFICDGEIYLLTYLFRFPWLSALVCKSKVSLYFFSRFIHRPVIMVSGGA